MWHWDGTITLGTVLEILSMGVLAVTGFNAISARLSVFETTLKDHANSLAQHALRLDRNDEKFLKVVGDLQRIIGRIETRDARR